MKKNGWVDKDLLKKKKKPKKKSFEEKGPLQNAKKNITSMKSWVEEDLSKFRKKVYAKHS